MSIQAPSSYSLLPWSIWECLLTFISTFIDGQDSNLILLPWFIIPSSDLPQAYHHYILKPNCIKPVPPEVLFNPITETLSLYSPIHYIQSPVNSLQQISRIGPSCTSYPLTIFYDLGWLDNLQLPLCFCPGLVINMYYCFSDQNCL